MSSSTPSPGENIAVLRKALGWGQDKLAHRAGISVSLLRKIEQGTRAATPPVVASVAAAMKVETDRIYGQPFGDNSEVSGLLNDLRTAVRRYNMPREDVPPRHELDGGLSMAARLRADAKYIELLRMLPKLLGEVTAAAMEADGEPPLWTAVADVYSCAYTVAHRLGQPDLAANIVVRQEWAARQTWTPSAVAAAAWNEAGTHQTAGAYRDGLGVVERAISHYQQAAMTSAPERAAILGSLHLRGIVLASRAKDANATRDHIRWAKQHATGFDHDVLLHTLTFGPGNTALYELAALVELEKPDEAAQMAEPLLTAPPAGLRPTRLGRLCIDTARARLAVNDLDGAEQALRQAFSIAPQMTEVHPMSREVLRVLFVMHQLTRPTLLEMAQRTGLAPRL